MAKRIISPVTVYIVHHPECKEAGELASSLFRWFRLGDLSSSSSGAGLPVYFRRKLNKRTGIEKDSDPVSLQPVIDFDSAELNVVVVLVDHRMVFRPTWRKAIVEFAQMVAEENKERDKKNIAQRILLLPAATDDSFYRLGPLYQHFNPIRLLNMDQAEMEATIRRSATEATARMLRKMEKPDEDPKLDVFLSHAKRDGVEITKKIRDDVRNFGQMVAWYDANDLPVGAEWDQPMEEAAKKGTAAMIATVTDAYPTRPWCRQEVTLARTPNAITGKPRVWKVQPVVAVHRPGLEWVRGVPMLDGVPRIGWDSVIKHADTGRIFDRLVLEMLLHLVHRRVAQALDQRHKRNSECCFITWVPDVWTLSKLRHESKLHKFPKADKSIRKIVYPGYGLTRTEIDDLKPVISSFDDKAKLASFDEVWDSADAADKTTADNDQRLFIALAAGGKNHELAVDGVGEEHVNELMVQIARKLLIEGHQLAFGGTLGFKDKNELTESLIDTALNWYADQSAPGANSDKKPKRKTKENVLDPDTWPLVNHSAWPFYRNIPEEKRAELVGICQFEDIDPRAVSSATLESAYKRWDSYRQEERRANCPLEYKFVANALTRMRRKCSQDTDLRIVWGGRVKGAAGWMAGILEEVTFSLHYQKPVLIFGSLGGCAALLARYLEDPKAEWPDELSLEACADKKRDKVTSDQHKQKLWRRFNRGKNLVANFRKQIHDGTRERIYGVSRDYYREALNEASTRKILKLVVDVARQCQAEVKRINSAENPSQ